LDSETQGAAVWKPPRLIDRVVLVQSEMPLALSVSVAVPNWLIMLPFGILLLAIAFGPLIARHHWERHYHKLCVGLAGVGLGWAVLAWTAGALDGAGGPLVTWRGLVAAAGFDVCPAPETNL